VLHDLSCDGQQALLGAFDQREQLGVVRLEPGGFIQQPLHLRILAPGGARLGLGRQIANALFQRCDRSVQPFQPNIEPQFRVPVREFFGCLRPRCGRQLLDERAQVFDAVGMSRPRVMGHLPQRGEPLRYGEFDTVESACRALGLSYRRHTEAWCGEDAILVDWRPGMTEPLVRMGSNEGGDEGLVSEERVCEALGFLEAGQTAEGIAALQKLCPAVPEVPPFVLSGQVESGTREDHVREGSDER
jgi:hypothetical protein